MEKAKPQFMSTALELAARGLGSVEPNPMVGAVIVRDGRPIAAGWHGRFGGPHAERIALAEAERAGRDVRGATMYVTLEPCSHHGKTPPCADALIEAGLARVVVAMVDPDPQVSGRGIDKLRKAGVEVEVGVCEPEARRLLAPYVKLRTSGRPWVICKWAQTADGYLALPPGRPRWISGPESRRKVHELRSVCDGICVGAGTVLADDPLLTNRSGHGRQPLRIVLDGRLRTPPECQLIATADPTQPVLIATTAQALAPQPERAGALDREGVELLPLPLADPHVDFAALLDELGRRQCTRLLVEGGGTVLRNVLARRLADEIWAFVAPQSVDSAPEDLPRFDIARLSRSLPLPQPARQQCGADELLTFRLT